MKRDVLYLASPRQRIRGLKHLIFSARKNIILQMYLFAASGELATLRPTPSQPWARTVASWLARRKLESPEIEIIVLLDTQTIEDARNTSCVHPLTRHVLEAAGITVLHASLARTAYKQDRRFPAAARFHERWTRPGSALSKSEWASRQNLWQTFHNVEDHRKNIVIDSGRAGIVFSHNIIDQAMHWHENSFLLRGHAAQELYRTAVEAAKDALALPLEFSPREEKTRKFLFSANARPPAMPAPRSKHQTEILGTGPEIQEALARELKQLKENQIKQIRAASAYCSDLPLLHDLFKAGSTADVRILIDNCHALSLSWPLGFFLRNTVNLLCIHECRKQNLASLRIFPSTPLEMMHCKGILFFGNNSCLIAGQANFTPNSFSGAWLETDVRVIDPSAIHQFALHFDELWKRGEPVLPYSQMRPLARAGARLHAWIFLALLRMLSWFGLRY